jgi:two-component system, LytTR family, response regulator
LKIRTLIIDDEPHAREGIRLRLKEYPSISIVGECSSGIEAVKTINALHPDLLFLDIQMPGMNGFEVLQKVTVQPMPIIIFVTAYDKHAIQAFEYHALDYLLKPINEDRLKEALKAAIAESKHRNFELYAKKLKSVVDGYLAAAKKEPEEQVDPAAGKTFLSRLLIKSKENVSVIPVYEIDWIESAGDYVYVNLNSKKHLVRETLTALEKNLDPQQFVRIHRSAIVNVEKIKNLHLNESGDYDVFLTTGMKLKLSRTYRDHFQKVMKNTL